MAVLPTTALAQEKHPGAVLPDAVQESAANPGFVLEEWRVPSTCGEASHFEELVSAAIGNWPKEAPKVRVSIEVSRERRRYSLVLITHGSSGEGRRELRARTCKEILESGAVITKPGS
ncbi:MAG: hypothetical protein GY811_13525 [Myxococcales bacterium]|nr:hypothetical protein [Myxococcales bacterium]